MAPSYPGMKTGASGAAGHGVGMKRIAGLFTRGRTSETQLCHARVWITTKVDEDTHERLHDQPVGVVRYSTKDFDSTDEVWVKVDGKWMSSHRDNDTFVRAYSCTQNEFETDLAFELWPHLKYTARPIRSWFKKNRVKFLKWNFLTGVFFSVPNAAVGLLFLAGETPDFWTWMAFGFGLHFVSACVFAVVFEPWKPNGRR